MMCGIEVPDGQEFCSMCYGDPDYGNDGGYAQYLEDQALEHAREEEEAEYYRQLQTESEQQEHD